MFEEVMRDFSSSIDSLSNELRERILSDPANASAHVAEFNEKIQALEGDVRQKLADLAEGGT